MMDFLDLVSKFLKDSLGKSNFIRLFLAPVLVGIVILIVEYAVIQPLKKGLLRIILSFSLKMVLLATTVFLMTTTTLVIGNNLPASFTLGKFLPEISFTLTGLLSDANISLAAIIYSLIIVHLISQESDIHPILLSFLPPLLFFSWALAFIRDAWIVLLLVLVVSNIWLLGVLISKEKGIALYMALLLFPLNMLLLLALKIATPTMIMIGVIIFWVIQSFLIGASSRFYFLFPQSHRLGLFTLLCWPLNSLIFIDYNLFSSVEAWVVAAVIGAIQYMTLVLLLKP